MQVMGTFDNSLALFLSMQRTFRPSYQLLVYIFEKIELIFEYIWTNGPLAQLYEGMCTCGDDNIK